MTNLLMLAGIRAASDLCEAMISPSLARMKAPVSTSSLSCFFWLGDGDLFSSERALAAWEDRVKATSITAIVRKMILNYSN